MSVIQVSELTFYYDGSYDNVFEHVSFQMDTDWKLGLIGRNGKGKTTLFHLFLGDYEYRGSIKASVEFDYFPFQIENKKINTINIIEEVDAQYELWKICRELSLLEVDMEVLYRPFETLSFGEQTKVLLAVLFSKENHFLLIDEPTNHLDQMSRQILMKYLNQKSHFIIVSHDRAFLDGCIDHVLAINKQDIVVSQGNFSIWWQNKKNQDEFELAENERLKKDIKRLKVAAGRTEKWSDLVEKSKIGTHVGDRGAVGHKAAKMMKRAKQIERRVNESIEEKSTLLKNIEKVDRVKVMPLEHHKEKLVIVSEISFHYGERTVLDHISFEVKQGQRILLEGKNGCGKTSILKAILGEERSHLGRVEIASGLVISYVSQDTSHLKGSLKDYIFENKIDETLFKALLRKLDFSRIQFEKPMEEYSGGQKKKVLLAKSLCEKAHLYIWDEPLNYIDVFSRMQIIDVILEYKPTMLIVEHDKYFQEAVATKHILL